MTRRKTIKTTYNYGVVLNKLSNEELLRLIREGISKGLNPEAIGIEQTMDDWYHRHRIIEARARGLSVEKQ